MDEFIERAKTAIDERRASRDRVLRARRNLELYVADISALLQSSVSGIAVPSRTSSAGPLRRDVDEFLDLIVG